MKAKTLIIGFLCLVLAAPAVAGRYDDFTGRFANTADQAKVISASYFGGGGHEWLSSGGFAPDGRIILAGVTLSPQATIAGVKATVIGLDAPPAAEPAPPTKTEKDGKVVPQPFTWNNAAATGFIVICNDDMTKVISVSRFPHVAGGITSAAVAADGSIYVAGPAGPNLAKLGGDFKELRVQENGMTKGGTQSTYIAKLSPDATTAVWVRQMNAFSNAPKVTLLRDGTVKFIGPDIRTFDASGKLLNTIVVPGGINDKVAVNPIDGTYARGGEHHWSTGREPWRCPILNIYKSEGELLYQLYDWGGPYVGLENCRQVSDSAVRAVLYDDNGNLVFYGWSDGGNSVFRQQPNDVRRDANYPGLGMSIWGANVLSVSYIIKIETNDYKVVGGTLWSAYLKDKDKPNSIWIDTIGFAVDDSIAFAGRSAWGLIQTGNSLCKEDNGGKYVALLNDDCTSLRFCSAMPACGEARVGNDEMWGIVSGAVKGRTRMLYLTGAIAEGGAYLSKDGQSYKLPAPTVKPVQKSFAGGAVDGYALLLDAGPAPARAAVRPPVAAKPPAADEAQPQPEQPEKPAAPAKLPPAGFGLFGGLMLTAAGAFCMRRRGAAMMLVLAGTLSLATPATAQVKPEENHIFKVQPDMPTSVTVDAEFRDPTGKKWPMFFYGKPAAEGTYKYSSTRPMMFVRVECDKMCQPRGDQGRKIMGELVKDEKNTPKITLVVKSMSPWRTEEVEVKDNKGKVSKKQQTFSILDADLIVGTQRVAIKPKCYVHYRQKLDEKKNVIAMTAMIDAKTQIMGSQLGLKSPGATGPIDVRVSWTAYWPTPPKKLQ